MRHPDFKAPGKPLKLTARNSTMTGLFFSTLTPFVEPTEAEIDRALSILGMSRGQCVCAYCGDKKSEWDHFRPIISGRAPTGYITEIANLVPSCGKCNQSKSGSYWKDWILGNAPNSPKSRGIRDLKKRIARLETFESWKIPRRIAYEKVASRKQWAKHRDFLERVLRLLADAEKHARELRSLFAQTLVAERTRPNKSQERARGR